MPEIGLRDILINARQESYRMQHYYLGVEHLFIGLLDIQGGLTSSLLEERGLTTEYVVDAIRRKAGKGNRQRLWAGMPNTPRADVVLGIANDLALESGRQEISERDLLIAILDENDSIPVRVLRRFEVDTAQLGRDAHEKALNPQRSQPYISIEFRQATDSLPEEALFILRRMFYGYGRIRIERRLVGGYTSAVILVVTPVNADGMEDAAVVVKIDDADIILDEAQRYETHVRSSLPPLTARLEEKPTTSETSDLAGLKYTFIAGMNSSAQDLREAARDLANLGEWLRRELYPYFGKTWWKQNRPYRFQVWTEYDWLLPPLLTLDYSSDEAPTNAAVVRDPVRRARLAHLEYGDPVVVENFTVQRVYRDKNMIQLAIGKGSEAARRAYKINVRGLNLAQDVYYRGEVIERIAGRVWETRAMALLAAARSLEPDFDLESETIPGIGKPEHLPNPIRAYEDLLDRYVDGSLSKIHGDLHLGNILVGPNASAFLIDFAQTRNGHTLFDWACLEVSLLTDVVMPVVGNDWWSVRLVLRYLASLHKDTPDSGVPALNDVMQHVLAVREIVKDCLAREGSWSEYYMALTFCTLRAFMWETLSLGARRLMFSLGGLSIHELRARSTMTVDDGPATDFLTGTELS